MIATWLPQRECWLVGDCAYVNATVLKDRPAELADDRRLCVGTRRCTTCRRKRSANGRGRRERKATVCRRRAEMIEDTKAYPGKVENVQFGETTRVLRVQVIRNVLWYTGAKTEPVSLVLVRDEAGQWRDEALLVTSVDVSAEFVIAGYCRRWSVEVSFYDSKQFLGLHDPQVWSEASVERTHPMSWFVQSVTILWYAVGGQGGFSGQA